MKGLGMYRKNGESYDVFFYSDNQTVEVVGPLPKQEGSAGLAFGTRAKSEEEARQLVEKAGYVPAV